MLLQGRPLHGTNKHKYWLRFGLSREEWMARIEDCIRFLRSNEGYGQVDMHSMLEDGFYKESVIIKCYQYIWRQSEGLLSGECKTITNEASKILYDHFQDKRVTTFSEAKAHLDIETFNRFANKAKEFNYAMALNSNLSFVILQECGFEGPLFHKSYEQVNATSQDFRVLVYENSLTLVLKHLDIDRNGARNVKFEDFRRVFLLHLEAQSMCEEYVAHP